MKRISVTTLEVFRKFITNHPYTSCEDVENAVKGIFTGKKEYVDIGTAFHKIVEEGEGGYSVVKDKCVVDIGTESPSVTFNTLQVNEALSYKNSMPYAFNEVEIGKEFKNKYMTIWVGGRCDVLNGCEVRDIKTKFSPVSYMDYYSSCQWKFYLELLGLDTFSFDFFLFKGYKVDKHGYDVSELSMIRPGSIDLYRYDSMEGDNRLLVERFCEFVLMSNLYDFLKEH